ncbi:BRD4-interacting chromatin-remodeling complex-associated protein-like [Megalops cyprinoides]|uniref:BRD4-interacting chromatin-remodeling complex-associated protein-like n=1 Tax=Megalops cyprinoides TaxID=118141 RepID=UPI0018641604|nr:BRD4-interacting chromatin-remodeling complex-associated protein-like [Megalops cyprinoides]
MDDEDGRCLLDVICDPQALNDFLHGSETHLDTDDLLDGSADPSSSFFSSAGGHVPEVQASSQLSASVPAGVPSGSVDLDFLEDDDILGGSSPGGGGVGANSEPCDILQQSLAEANITEQSLQEAEAELDLGSFGIPGLTPVVQPLHDPGLAGAGGAAVGVGIGVGGSAQIFPGAASSSTATPPGAAPDMIGPVLAHPGLQLQSQVMNKAISVQPFMQQVGLGNVTLQPISGLQALPNGSQSGHLGIGQIQVVGQPTVMTINQSGQPILAKTVGGYQLHQPGPETGAASAQARLGASVLSSTAGGGLLIQGGKANLASPALNGAVVGVSSTSTTNSLGGSTMTTSSGLVGFSGAPLGAGIAAQQKALNQGALMQNVIIQRTPTPIQPKPPQGGVIQPRLPTAPSLQNDASKALGVQQGQVPVTTSPNVAFLAGKPSGNVVLSTQAAPQGASFPQAIFKQQAPHTGGKPLSVHVLNQSGSIVIPSQTVLQGQNHQFLLPQLQAGGQILAQHPGGHIITSQGPGGQLIANQILATNQNLNLGQVLGPQGHPGTAHILSGPIQLQPGQIGHPTVFQMPVSLAQTQTQAHPVVGQAQTVIQGMPLQNSLAMLSQVEGLGPAVSLQPPPPQLAGSVPSSSSGGSRAAVAGACQPVEGVAVLGGAADQAPHPAPPPSILTVQTAPPVSVPVPTSLSSSPSSSSASSSSNPPVAALTAPPAQHSPGKLLLAPQGSGMILSHDSLMFLQQEQQQQQQQQTGSASPTSGCVPASVIVSSNAAPAPSGRDGLSAEAWLGQSSAHPVGPSNKAAVVYQIPSTGHQQQTKGLGASPSHPLSAHSAASSLGQTGSPQPAQPPSVILGQQIQSPLHQQQQSRPPSEPPPQIQPQPPSRSCTPSSLPPLFIIHNQIGDSPQQPQQPQPQAQPLAQSRPPSQPAPFQQEAPPSSCSPKPPRVPPVQFQFAAPPAGASLGAAAKQQAPVLSLTAEQQQTLQLVSAQLQTLSAIAQPSPQQKQLLDRLHQVQHSIILQAKQQAQPQTLGPSQFSPQQDTPSAHIVASSAGASTSMLQQTTVLVKTPAPVSSEVKVFPGAPATAGPVVKQEISSVGLTQSVQSKQGVINSVGGLSVAKGGLQVMGTGVSQLSAPQPPAPVQTQTTALKMPFSMKPSKEARMLEQLRKQQGSVLHPDYSSPFRSFADALQRLIPYHLYQGTPSSLQDYRRVDEEFESVSSQLLKRTQAMLDKYRLLLFEESKRLGPSAEMVMIDRMFIQEEKTALNQDRLLAKERPDEYAALQSATASTQHPAEPSAMKAAAPAAATPTQTPAPTHYPPTKLVIKQGGGGASVSWSTSSAPTPAAARLGSADQGSSLTSTPGFSRSGGGGDDDDSLPQRSSKPPIKTYEARRRIGLKLKIKQEAGLTKVVHNTALDPVHSQSQPPPRPDPQQRQSPQKQQQPRPATPAVPAVAAVRTPPRTCSSAPSPAVSVVTSLAGPAHRAAPSSTVSTSLSSSTSSFSSPQMNGTLEHHEVGGGKGNAVATPPTSCRLPLRKTYRENISPPLRPGVAGGGGTAHPPQHPANLHRLSPRSRGSPSPPGRTVIASMKVENRGGKGHSQDHTNAGRGPGGGGANAQSRASSPGLMHELAEVEEAFYRGMVKNRHPLHHSGEEDEEQEDRERGGGLGRVQGGGGKGRERPPRAEQQAPAPPSPTGSSCSWDSLLPAKRHKSDSPDMDNASFSSGSPPPDDSLNEHLQSAIDSILNLQQGAPSACVSGSAAGAPGVNPSHQSQTQRRADPSAAPYRPAPPLLASQRSQLGGAGGEFSSRGQNGKLASRTYSR